MRPGARGWASHVLGVLGCSGSRQRGKRALSATFLSWAPGQGYSSEESAGSQGEMTSAQKIGPELTRGGTERGQNMVWIPEG